LAGLQCSNNYIANAALRQKINNHMKACGIGSVNLLGKVATEAAYRHGAAWLDSLLDYIRVNQQFFYDSINAVGLPVKVLPMDSLYLAWMDCRQMGLNADELFDFMLCRGRLWFDDGRKFGPQAHGFLRVNLGCPRSTVAQAVDRLHAVFL